jgi:hypothetical protein
MIGRSTNSTAVALELALLLHHLPEREEHARPNVVAPSARSPDQVATRYLKGSATPATEKGPVAV